MAQQLLGRQSGGLGHWPGRAARAAGWSTAFCTGASSVLAHAQVEPIQVVQAAAAQQAGQMGAHRIGRLLRDERNRWRRHLVGAPVQLRLERGVAQCRRDHAGTAQQAQMAVGQLLQLGFIGVEIIGRAALRDQQAQRLFVDLRLLAEIAGLRGRMVQNAVDVLEIAPVPDPQAVAQAMHFAKAGLADSGIVFT